MTNPKADPLNAACRNTDREIYHTPVGSMYDDSIHVTEGGGIGISVGGRVIVRPLRDWHALASKPAAAPDMLALADRLDECEALKIIYDDRKEVIQPEEFKKLLTFLRGPAILAVAPGECDEPEAIAWIVLSTVADQVRIWWRNKEPAVAWAAQHNRPLIPLYAKPFAAHDFLALSTPPVVAGADRAAVIEAMDGWHSMAMAPADNRVLVYNELWEDTHGGIQIATMDHDGRWHFDCGLNVYDITPDDIEVSEGEPLSPEDFLPHKWRNLPTLPRADGGGK